MVGLATEYRWMQPGWNTRRWKFPTTRALSTAPQTASVTDDEAAFQAPAATAREYSLHNKCTVGVVV